MKCIKISVLFMLFSIASQYCFAQNENIENYLFGDPNSIFKKNTTFSFEGQISELQSNNPIIGVNISVEGNNQLGTSTNVDGKFSLKMSPGIYRINFEFIGFKTKTIELSLFANGSLQLSMAQEGIELEQIVISDRSAKDNIEQVITGLDQLGIKELRQTSRLLGELDVLRSIQSLSGVTSVGDGASGFNVRGGNADENLILQDNALILNPSHTLGFFSLFHPDLVSEVNLYKGDQPAHLGGRLSSVLDVKLREGNKEKTIINGGVGFATSRLTLEGPIKKNRSSFLMGGRISHMGWILDQIKNINVQRSKAFFYDLTAKVDTRLGAKTNAGITAFASADEFNFADEVNFEYKTRTINGFINHLLSDQWSLNLNINVGDYNSSLFDIQGNDVSKFTNKVSYIRPSIKSIYQIDDSKRITFGTEINIFAVSPGSISPESDLSTVTPKTLKNEKAYALSPSLQYEWDIDESFAISAGLRYTHYNRVGAAEVLLYEAGVPKSERSVTSSISFADGKSIINYTALEPRLSVRKNINERSSIKASFNRSFQYLNQISNTSSSTPIDIWQLSDYHIGAQLAYNYAIGWYQNFDDGAVQSSIQLFYRQQPDVVEYRDFADLLLNEHIEREIVNGEGKAYGIELNYQKETERTDWQINYTFSRSLRKVVATPEQSAINNGEWYGSNFDKPHSLNMRFSQKVARIAELSVNFTYSTGRPLTVPVSNFAVDNIRSIPIYSERNAFRIPDYHRLDISYSIGPFGDANKKWKSTLVFSVFNVYGRDNAYSVFFRQRPSQSVEAVRIATLGSAFPSVTYNFSF